MSKYQIHLFCHIWINLRIFCRQNKLKHLVHAFYYLATLHHMFFHLSMYTFLCPIFYHLSIHHCIGFCLTKGSSLGRVWVLISTSLHTYCHLTKFEHHNHPLVLATSFLRIEFRQPVLMSLIRLLYYSSNYRCTRFHLRVWRCLSHAIYHLSTILNTNLHWPNSICQNLLLPYHPQTTHQYTKPNPILMNHSDLESD